MMLGALVDAGAPLDAIQAAIDCLDIGPVTITQEAVTRNSLGATKVEVDAPPSTEHRTWNHIRNLLECADLDERVKELAIDAFRRLARAEAAAHRVTIDQVHFHEVGAVDAIADIVGTCTAFRALGITEASASMIALGQGWADAAHGRIPVPGPAVLGILAEAGAPVQLGTAWHETCTPTGAALLAAICKTWGDMAPMRVVSAGLGAGSRDTDSQPNVLRVIVGEPLEPSSTGVAWYSAGVEPAGRPTQEVLLETNVDDLDPRVWPTVLSQLMDAGARDVWLTPVLMKKGRPGHVLSALVEREHAATMRQIIFRETSTLGMREVAVNKHWLDREFRTVTVRGSAVRVKIGYNNGEVCGMQPEYVDVHDAAQHLDMPLKEVLAEAIAAARASG